MGGDFVELRLNALCDSGELLAFLPSNEAVGAWEDAGVICIYWPAEAWSPRILEELDAALVRLGVDLHEADPRVGKIADRDWNELWSRSIRPMRIGERVLVRQSWNPIDVPPGVVELIIDPKRAFGSGFHATTQLLVEWIVGEIRGGESVLDVGTGSGILAMTALRCGAERALGVDNDEGAIECALENALLNGFGHELELRVADAAMAGSAAFDVIVANIDRKTLLSCAGRLGRNLAHGGRLFLSGLLEEDWGDISKALAADGGSVEETRRRDGWIALKVRFC